MQIYFYLQSHSIYMIVCSLVVLLYHHYRSLLAVSYSKHRVAQMFKKVNKQFYCKYNYFPLVSTVITVNILLHGLFCLSFYFIITLIVYCQLSIMHYQIFTCQHVLYNYKKSDVNNKNCQISRNLENVNRMILSQLLLLPK